MEKGAASEIIQICRTLLFFRHSQGVVGEESAHKRSLGSFKTEGFNGAVLWLSSAVIRKPHFL